MTRHDHQVHEGESLKDAARDRLTKQGEQWTEMRAAVFDALASFENKPASAYDIADCLHDCIFLICDQCGQTVHIDDDQLSTGVRQAAKSAGFSAPRPVIEVRGTCGDCEGS